MKYLVSFVLETKNNRNGEARVRMRVKWHENTVTRYIQYTVNPEKWSKETRRCLPNTTHGKYKVSASVINSEIQRFEDFSNELLKKNPTKEDFSKEIDKFAGKDRIAVENTFKTIFDQYVQIQSVNKGWTEKNIQKNNVIRDHLLRFNPNINFNDLEDSETIDKFIQYLNKPSSRMNENDPTKGIHNSTVERYISMLKWFLTWAKEKGYYNGNQNKYKIEIKGTDAKMKVPIFFTWKELLRFYEFDFKNKTYEAVRDCISFCCFTSLRHSDLITLRRSDVKENHIVVFTEKSDERLYIDLNDYSRSILNKYKDNVYPDDLALPVMSNQKMNDYIKEMGKIMEFDTPTRVVYYIGAKRYEEVMPKYELFSTHMGRRTFIVNALYLGIPAEVIMKWTGHEDYESMKPYIAIVDTLKNNEMNKFNKKSPT